jgi:hypothetical protein
VRSTVRVFSFFVSPRRILVAFALALGACGSDPATKPAPTAQTGSDQDVLTQVLSGCTDFGRRLCANARPCCEQTAPFVEDDCVAAYVEKVCMPSAQLVAAGFAVYDPSAADACLSAHERAYAECLVDWDETIALRRELWASCRVIDGTVAEGQGCDDDARCALPEGEDATAACVANVCRKIELLPAGAACPFPNGDVSTCDTGLYCTAVEAGKTGTCVPATPEGAACAPTFLNLECGLGSYCDQTEGVCKKATNFGGPSCNQDTECVSFICDRTAGQCAPALTTAASLCPVP